MSKLFNFLNRNLAKILWTAAILVWVVVGIYYLFSYRTTPLTPQINKEETDSQRTYKSQYGYSIKYPANFSIMKRGTISDEVLDMVVFFVKEEDINEQIMTVKVVSQPIQTLTANTSGTNMEKVTISGKEVIRSSTHRGESTVFEELLISATDSGQTIVVAGFSKLDGKDYSQAFEEMLKTIKVF